MERKTYLGRYQVSIDERGEPIALERTPSSVTLKAEDTTSGEPVALQIVRPGPLEQIPLDKVEAEARTAQELDHVNIARLRDFGLEGGDIIYAREFLEGSTLAAWVAEHGPLPVAAVMRIALQGVNALAAAAFKSVTHRALQPANVMIVPGQTPEGDWPLIKILNFGLPAPTFSRTGFTTIGPGDLAQFASPEQLQGATPDFKSDIYSLGATLWFLLTGAPPRAGMVQRSRGIPKNVAAVISRMVASNPEHRPIDPLVLQEDIRGCLGRAERRDAIGRRFGLPAKVAKPAPVVAAAALAAVPAIAPAPEIKSETVEPEPVAPVPAAVAGPPSIGRFLLRPLAWAAVLLTIGAIAAMTLPGAIRSVRNWQAQKQPEEIGVKVGVPESTANALAANPVGPAPAAPDAQTAAPVAPEVSPPQDTTVAANRTAPATAASPSFPNAGSSEQSQPTVAAATTTSSPQDSRSSDAGTTDNTTAPQTAAPAMAYTNNTGAAQATETASATQSAPRSESAATQQQAPATNSTSRAPVIAANTTPAGTPTTEPAAPAEGPDDSVANAQNNTRLALTATKRDSESEGDTSPAAKAGTASAEGERKTKRSASTSKARTKTAARSGLTAEERTEIEVRQALPITPEEEAALPPVPRGSKRARYLGTTPDGALVFGMPSAERVFIAPPAAEAPSRRNARRALPEEAPPPRAEPVVPEELAEVEQPDEDEE